MRRFSFHSGLMAAMFDSAIVFLLLVSGVTLTWTLAILTSGLTLSPLYRGILTIITIIMGTGALLTLWGSMIEPYLILVVRKKTVHLPLHTTLRIAVVSDFHVGVYNQKRFIAKVVRKINALKPDLILLPGDFLDDEKSETSQLSPLKDLKARYGVFAVTGNHDAGAYMKHFSHVRFYKEDRSADVEKTLLSYGITFLRNATHTISINGEKLIIAGTDDSFMHSCDPTKTLRTVPAHTPVIMLSHTPDIILQKSALRANLIVSGHTHGGQIRLPVIGPLYVIPDDIGRHFDRGIFRITKSCTLAITEGVGVTGVRARLFCPPEILLIETTSRLPAGYEL